MIRSGPAAARWRTSVSPSPTRARTAGRTPSCWCPRSCCAVAVGGARRPSAASLPPARQRCRAGSANCGPASGSRRAHRRCCCRRPPGRSPSRLSWRVSPPPCGQSVTAGWRRSSWHAVGAAPPTAPLRLRHCSRRCATTTPAAPSMALPALASASSAPLPSACWSCGVARRRSTRSPGRRGRMAVAPHRRRCTTRRIVASSSWWSTPCARPCCRCALLAAPQAAECCTWVSCSTCGRRWSAVPGRGVGLFDLIASLHPTPAVGGVPVAAARQLAAGAMATGGAPGTAAASAGSIVTATVKRRRAALRADAMAAHAELFAGAGIVAGSDPAQELAETEVKLAVIADGLALHACLCAWPVAGRAASAMTQPHATGLLNLRWSQVLVDGLAPPAARPGPLARVAIEPAGAGLPAAAGDPLPRSPRRAQRRLLRARHRQGRSAAGGTARVPRVRRRRTGFRRSSKPISRPFRCCCCPPTGRPS
jgi:hypothetical protein